MADHGARGRAAAVRRRLANADPVGRGAPIGPCHGRRPVPARPAVAAPAGRRPGAGAGGDRPRRRGGCRRPGRTVGQPARARRARCAAGTPTFWGKVLSHRTAARR